MVFNLPWGGAILGTKLINYKSSQTLFNIKYPKQLKHNLLYTTQNLLRITFSFNDLMLKTNRLEKDFFYKDRLIFGLDDPVANMSIRHVYYA